MARALESRKRVFERLASLRLEVLSRLSDRHAEIDFQRKVGLSLLQCRMLGLIGSNGEMTFKRVYRDTGLEKSHASRIVTSLIEAGLLRKASDPADQRSIVLTPTARGKKLHKQVMLIAVKRNDRWLEVLSPEQRAQFLTCIDLLTQQSRKLAARMHSPTGSTRPKGTRRTGTIGVGKTSRRRVAASKNAVQV
jgi:DNA-binding MarR family transcriptional regulator